MNGLLGTPIGSNANTRSLKREIVHVREEQPVGTGPASGHSAGVWNVRVLNAIVRDDIGIRLAANQMWLPAGQYLARMYGPCMNGSANKVRLRDVSRGITLALGGNNYTEAGGDGGYVMTRHMARDSFTLTRDAVVEYQNFMFDAGPSSWTAGISAGALGQTVEVYGQAILWRVSA